MTNEPGGISEAMASSSDSSNNLPPPSRIHITEFSDSSRINPEPISLQQESDLLLDDYLSAGKLRALSGCMELNSVTALELSVNTTENTLGNFGRFLPNLSQLKLSNSSLSSIRDLGTSLNRLNVIWVTRCGLQDLDGLSALMQITELYASYNNISDLSECSMLDNLQILDLEGNAVDDIHQVELLSMCQSLQTLTLNNNPICLSPGSFYDSSQLYDYRRAIRQILQGLQQLDDFHIKLTSTEVEEKSTVLTDDVLIVTDAIKNTSVSQPTTADECLRPSSAGRPSSRGATNPRGHRPATGVSFLDSSQRPYSASARLCAVSPPSDRSGTSSGSRPGSSESAPSPMMEVFEEASELTYGTGEVLCGNPIRALKSRHRILHDKVIIIDDEFQAMRHEIEHTYDASVSEDIDQGRDLVLTELKEWREQNFTRFSSPADSSQVLTLNLDTSPTTGHLESDSDLGETILTGATGTPHDEQVSPHPPNHPKQSTASYLRKIKLQQPLLPDKPSTSLTPSGREAEFRHRRLRLSIGINHKKSSKSSQGGPAPFGREYDEAMLISNTSRSPSADSGSESFNLQHQPNHRAVRYGLKASHSKYRGPSGLPPPPRPPGGMRPASARAALRPMGPVVPPPVASERLNNISPSSTQRTTVTSESA